MPRSRSTGHLEEMENRANETTLNKRPRAAQNIKGPTPLPSAASEINFEASTAIPAMETKMPNVSRKNMKGTANSMSTGTSPCFPTGISTSTFTGTSPMMSTGETMMHSEFAKMWQSTPMTTEWSNDFLINQKINESVRRALQRERQKMRRQERWNAHAEQPYPQFMYPSKPIYSAPPPPPPPPPPASSLPSMPLSSSQYIHPSLSHAYMQYSQYTPLHYPNMHQPMSGIYYTPDTVIVSLSKFRFQSSAENNFI